MRASDKAGWKRLGLGERGKKGVEKGELKDKKEDEEGMLDVVFLLAFAIDEGTESADDGSGVG